VDKLQEHPMHKRAFVAQHKKDGLKGEKLTQVNDP
jgi:hypothetical protein